MTIVSQTLLLALLSVCLVPCSQAQEPSEESASRGVCESLVDKLHSCTGAETTAKQRARLLEPCEQRPEQERLNVWLPCLAENDCDAFHLCIANAHKQQAEVQTDGDEDAERLVSLIEEMGSIIESNASDCEQMGDDLGDFVASNAKELQRLMPKVKNDAEAIEKYRSRMEKVESRMDAMGECYLNTKVMKALEKLLDESDTQADEPHTDGDEDAERLVSLMEELGSIIESNAADCEQMADDLGDFAASNAKEFHRLLTKLKNHAETNEHRSRMDRVQRQMDAIGECHLNTNVMKSFEKLFKASDTQADEPHTDDDEDAERLASLMEVLGSIIEAHAGDCERMGDATGTFAASNATEFRTLMTKLKGYNVGQERFQMRMRRVESQMRKIGDCVSNEKVSKAFEMLSAE